jgi:predicted amino acid dehydrogenase
MKDVLILSFQKNSKNFDRVINFLDQPIRVKKICVQSLELGKTLLTRYASDYDAVAIQGLPSYGENLSDKHAWNTLREFIHVSGQSRMTNGFHLKSLALPLLFKNFYRQDSRLRDFKSIFVASSVESPTLNEIFSEHFLHQIYGDIFTQVGLPLAITRTQVLKKVSPWLKKCISIKPERSSFSNQSWNAKKVFSQLQKTWTEKLLNSALIFCHSHYLDQLLTLDLTGKTLIVDEWPETNLNLDKHKIERVISLFPTVFQHHDVGYAGLEALMMVYYEKTTFDQEDLFDTIIRRNLLAEQFVPRVLQGKTKQRFAFIIHPLSSTHLFNDPLYRPFKPLKIQRPIEKLSSHLQGFLYAKMTGIESAANGKCIEADLYCLPMTPKVMLECPKEEVYTKLIRICADAQKRGAKIIGLGAYTKIVGDAGITVNKHSPIPVTTGNSLSASSTLWAASYAVEKMKLVEKKNNMYLGTVMVVGATGSIGKVLAKILLSSWKKMIVCAPRPYKVLELVHELQATYPDREVIATTSADKYSHECDLIITTTSAQGEKVLDIQKVKPGCVVCDVSRPFDITLEDASTRPDVLVIASGEVTLPGQVEITKTINLPKGTVYACLAETALLLLEDKLESFSLSRDLQYEKVIEIDRMARKHGVRLANIMGHVGEISESEIELCRTHALKALKFSPHSTQMTSLSSPATYPINFPSKETLISPPSHLS